MLHLRVIAPVELRDEVLDALAGNPGVAHLVLHPDAARDPVGDEITADIARESANEVVNALKALGVKERGAITLDVIDTVLSTRAYRAEEKAAGDPADAVVWDELAGRTREESTLNVTFLMFLCLACLIAAVGVVTDSPVTVVGAMVVGPGIRPAGGIAVALVRRKTYLGRRAALALLVGFPVAMLVTALGVLAGEAVGWIDLTTTLRHVTKSTSSFRWVRSRSSSRCSPVRPECCRLVSAKSAALVGVFISVTTVPAAGFAVVAAIRRRLGHRRQVRRPARGQPARNRARRGPGAVLRPRGHRFRAIGTRTWAASRAVQRAPPV